MKWAVAEKTVRGYGRDNSILKGVIGVQALVIGYLAFALATVPPTTVVIPPFQSEEIKFVDGKANHEYYEQWAWSMAMLMGNISPANANFVREGIEKMTTPALFRQMAANMDEELQNIQRDKAVVEFSPRDIIYDPELDLFFVVGRQTLSGPGVRNPIEKQITYEMGFVLQRNRIFLDRYDVYTGKPMTSDIREQELAKRAELAKREERKQ